MAEETVNSLVSCEKNDSDVSSLGESSVRKPSAPDNVGIIHPDSNKTSTDSGHAFSDSRRNSTGKSGSLNSNQEIVPHYLRASTGSCHDFCKYGHKHAFEEKERYPFRKRIIRTPSEKQNPAISVSLVERKKATMLKRMVSPNLKSISLKNGTSPDATNLADPPEIIKLLPSEKVEMALKCDPLSQHKKSKAEKRMNNFSNKHSPSFQPPPMKQSSSFQVLKSAKKVEKAERTMNNWSLKSSSSVGPQPSAKKAEKDEKAGNKLSQKSSPAVGRQRAVSESSSFFCTPQSINGRGKGKNDMKAIRNMVVTKASAKKLFATPTPLLSPKPSVNQNIITKRKNRSLKVISPLKDQKRIQKELMEKTEKAPEKTLHVIMVETKNNFAESTEDTIVALPLAPQSSPSPMSVSPPLSPSLSSHEGREGEYDAAAAADGDGDDDDADADGDEEEEEEEEEGGEEEEEEGELEDYDDEEEEVEDENGYAFETTGKFSDKNGMAKNDAEAVERNLGKTLLKGVVFRESKDPRPVKLKFKRGKVVDLQSENTGPRRLRFRRGSVMEGNHDPKGEIRRRNFKKKGPGGDGNGTNPSNEKVVLRHQDVQGRKDAQGLFNNVIEETASKLVESRKSKVKALVGAFETVISLQDIRPSPQTVS